MVLGEQLQIICTATNDQNAPEKLMFSWSTPNGLQFNVSTTDEDDSLTATSTLYISNVTHNHDGMYHCSVRNADDKLANSSKATNVIVEGKYIFLLMLSFYSCMHN